MSLAFRGGRAGGVRGATGGGRADIGGTLNLLVAGGVDTAGLGVSSKSDSSEGRDGGAAGGA